MSTQNTGRIQVHGAGVGEISSADIETRAGEIARMDGRPKAGAQDRQQARDELEHPGPPPAPEADETVKPVQLWSQGVASEGHRGIRTKLDDEVSPGELLVNEGLEEAERDQRLSASEESQE